METFSHLNIIADIAGQFDALERLYARMPLCHTVLVGDMIDRGPKSKEVLEWAKEKSDAGLVTALYGNHEDMMIDFVVHGESKYALKAWPCNGGRATWDSFNGDFPPNLMLWVDTLPIYIERPAILITHAGVSEGDESPITWLAKDRDTFIWNRRKPVRRKQYQVFGHNSHWGLKTFSDEQGDFATCIDASQSRVLTGMHWPTKAIFQEPY
jgi:serine/threonine protein phosphatase 1